MSTSLRCVNTRSPNTVRVSTIHINECVIVHIREGTGTEGGWSWRGVVVAVDPVAVRIDAYLSEFGGMSFREDDQRVIPWNMIDSIDILTVNGGAS